MSSRFSKKKPTKPLSKVDQALRLAKSNKKKIGETIEFKSSTSTISSAALNATPTVLYLGAIGVAGFRATLKSFRIRGVFKQNLTSAIIDDYRMDLVLDRTPAKVIITPTLYLGAAAPILEEFKLFSVKGRYKILRTWKGYLNGDVGGKSFDMIDDYVRLNLVTETDTVNSLNQDEVIKNALYLVRWTTATANQPLFQGRFRLVFSDSN